jgi:hypothetical protein
MEFDIAKHTIFLVLSGSHAYGMSRPESDIDVKGIAIPPAPYFHGYLRHFEQFEGQIPLDYRFDPDCAATFGDCLKTKIDREIVPDEHIDSVVYDIRKICKLLADCNPNIIEMLFSDPSCHLWMSSAMEPLIENRDLFLSTKVKWTFSGYAWSQLKRIKTHRSWLLNPPFHKPTRADFGLPECSVMPRDQLMAAESLIKRKVEEWLGSQEELPRDILEDIRTRTTGAIRDIWSALVDGCWFVEKESFGYRISKPEAPLTEDGELDDGQLCHAAGKLLGYDDNFLKLLDMERGYRSQIRHFQQYEEWKKSRNPARAELEAKFQMDTKHAAHLVRLMRMCKEILTTGKVIVKRPDADELLAIRNGAWSYDKLIEWAEQQDRELTELYDSGKSPLPKKPDVVKIDALCQRIIEEALRNV